MTKKYQRIPAAPFVAWLQAKLELLSRSEIVGGHVWGVRAEQTLASALGFHVRCLYRYARSLDSEGEPTDTFPRDPVEDALDRYSPGGGVFAELYPGVVAADGDVELEPDIYCESCSAMVTPIGGRCPWCTLEPEHPFACPGCGRWKSSRHALMCMACRRVEREAA